MAESSLSSHSPPDKESVEENYNKLAKLKGKQKLTYDFNFLLKPSTKFHHSIASLSDYIFNPTKMGLIEVDPTGLSITVFYTSKSEEGCTEETVFGLLRLQPEFFNHFECLVPVRKMINLEQVLLSLAVGRDNWLLNVFSEHESNLVTFEFEPPVTGQSSATVRPNLSNVDLLDASPNYQAFPDIVYGVEASIPSSYITPIITELLKKGPDERPDFTTLVIEKPSVSIRVGDKEVTQPAERVELWLNWPFWATLRRATQTSGECTVYMVEDPVDSIMMLFKLADDPDDMVSFSKGYYSSVKTLSCLAFLRSLT